MNKYLITFYTHFGALKFKNECKESSITDALLMPTPRSLSSSCGICVVFSHNSFDFVKNSPPEDMEKAFLVLGEDSYRQIMEC